MSITVKQEDLFLFLVGQLVDIGKAEMKNTSVAIITIAKYANFAT